MQNEALNKKFMVLLGTSCSSWLFSFSLRDHMFRSSLGEPLIPRSVVQAHVQMTAKMSGEGDVTGSYTRATGDPEGLLHVNTSLQEKLGKFLHRKFQTCCLVHEAGKRHVDRARDMPRFNVCDTRRDKNNAPLKCWILCTML